MGKVQLASRVSPAQVPNMYMKKFPNDSRLQEFESPSDVQFEHLQLSPEMSWDREKPSLLFLSEFLAHRRRALENGYWFMPVSFEVFYFVVVSKWTIHYVL